MSFFGHCAPHCYGTEAWESWPWLGQVTAANARLVTLPSGDRVPLLPPPPQPAPQPQLVPLGPQVALMPRAQTLPSPSSPPSPAPTRFIVTMPPRPRRWPPASPSEASMGTPVVDVLDAIEQQGRPFDIVETGRKILSDSRFWWLVAGLAAGRMMTRKKRRA